MPFGPFPLGIPTNAAKWTLLSSLVDLLSSTLGQMDFAVTQKLVVDQRLLSIRVVHRSSAKIQNENGDSTRSHSDVSEVSVSALVSSSILQ